MKERVNIRFISKLYHHNSSKVQRLIHLHEKVDEIILIVNGKSEYVLDGVSRQVKKGDVIICPQGMTHYERIEKNRDMDYFCLGVENFSDLIRADSSKGIICVSGSRFEFLAKSFESIYENLSVNSVKAKKGVDDFISCVLDFVHENSKSHVWTESNVKYDVLSNDIFRYISCHFDNTEMTLEFLSDIFHVSESLISHRFSDTYEQPPMKFLQCCRIGRTQSELIVTDKLITDISFEAGYNNLSNYNATFLKKIGMSPRQYRLYYRGLDYKQIAYS